MSHLSVPEIWRTRVVLLTLLEKGVTEEQLKGDMCQYGTIVRVQMAKSLKNNTIAYISFVDPHSVSTVVRERRTHSATLLTQTGKAKVPEGGEWTKWIQPSTAEYQNARRLRERIEASSRAAVAIPSPPAPVQSLPPPRPPLLVELDPRQIFFIGSLLSANEQTKELKLAFGENLQSFHLFVADVIKAGKQWFPASLERCDSFSEFDDHSVVCFTNQVSDSPRWKSFLKKADPRYRSSEKILTNHFKQTQAKRDYEHQLALFVAHPLAPNPSTPSDPPYPSPARIVPAPVVPKPSSSNVLERLPPRPATSTRPTAHLENLDDITAKDYLHFDAPSTSLKDFYHLNVQQVASPRPAQPLVGSTNAVAGPSRTSEHTSNPITSTSVSSRHHPPLPQDPRRAAPLIIRRPPSPPPPQPSAFSSSSTNLPTSQQAEKRRPLSPEPAARSIAASSSSRETARGRSPPRASDQPVEIEDATMADVEQPSSGPPVQGRVMLGPTGARVVPRGRRRSASPGYVPPARLLQPRPQPRKSRATDPVSFLQDLNPNPGTRMSRDTAAKMLKDDTELREWVWAEVVAVKEKEKGKEKESKMDLEGGGEGGGSGRAVAI